MDLVDLRSSVLLKYTIHKYSSYSSKFAPENILVDKPQDQTSRWSSDSHVPPQYLIMKLESAAIATSITFGKYEKSHVCNVKKLQVWGGLSEDHMMLLLDGGLKNDSHPETFSLKHTVAGMPFPVRYIKLLPLQAWGSTFNFSIWHVSVAGCPDPALVRRCIHTYTLYCEREALRVCLKHLRHHRYTEAFTALTREANTRLEHPVLTRLYQACTQHDGTQLIETLISRALQSGLFNEYLSGQPLVPVWRQLLPPPGAAPNATPGMRGGHQLCCDTHSQSIYLFGGWDGQEDLSDLWCYNIPSNEWSCVSPDTRLQGGPSPRSCHKVCLDAERRQLFTLGRYVDSKMRTSDNLKSDFYLYELDSGRWTLITEDTAEVGGPRLVFDHQMVMDSQKRVIYVFGGRVLTQSRWEGVGLENDRGVSSSSSNSNSSFSPAEPQFSGLYRYDVATNTWSCLRDDDSVVPGRSSTANNRTTDVGQNTTSSPSASGAVTTVSSSVTTSPRTMLSASSSPAVSSCSSSSSSCPPLRSRVGHSMLFHPITRQLFILAGQRNKEYLTDFFTYQQDKLISHVLEVDTDVITCISEKNSFRMCYRWTRMSSPASARRTHFACVTGGHGCHHLLQQGKLMSHVLQVDTDVITCISKTNSFRMCCRWTRMSSPASARQTHFARVAGGHGCHHLHQQDKLILHMLQVDTDVITCISEKNSGGRGCTSISAVGTGGAASSVLGLSIMEGAALLGAGFSQRQNDLPPAGFTQKATIDPILEEIHVLSGLSKEKDKRDTVCNSFWVYSIPLNKWSCIYHNEVSGDGPDSRGEPCPRFAHQLVYDHVNKVHYMFGGNPGRHHQPKMRLDDFWSLQLSRPSPEKLLQEIIFTVRKSWYEELAVRDSTEALRYLQTELHEAVNHNNPEQVAELQRLACTLFQPADPEICQPPPLTALPQPPPQDLPLFTNLLSPLPSPSETGASSLGPGASPLNTGASASSSPLPMDLSNSPRLPEAPAQLLTAAEQLDAWRHRHRSELFNVLTKYFPESMTQPQANLVDLVNL
ncbi:Muskelin N-terminal [Trinorchestia longiramus]|nr:Muskelin N-terminal [Trinorchestia longiramus]